MGEPHVFATRIALVGYGPVGRAIAPLLSAVGKDVRVVQRRVPASIPDGCSFVSADIEDASEAARACAGVDVVVCAVGIPYISRVYVHAWPKVMRNLLDACAASQARFVFADSLYMYGPQTRPLVEDMPLTSYGQKPRIRADITRLWQDAHARGSVRAIAVRASDFYGPDVNTSVLSSYGVARLLAGKSALAPYNPDHPHDFTYVPDYARAVATLIDAPDDAYGQAWHVPNAPTRTLRELLTLASQLLGVAPQSPCCLTRSRRLSASSSRKCANLPKCAFNGIAPTSWTRANLPPDSGTIRHLSKSGLRRQSNTIAGRGRQTSVWYQSQPSQCLF